MDMNWSFRVRFSMKNLWCMWCNDYIKSRPRAAPHLRLKYSVCLFCQNFDCIQDRNVVNYAIFTIFYCLHLQQTIPWGSGLKQFRRTPCIYKATKWGQSFKKPKIHPCSKGASTEHPTISCSPSPQWRRLHIYKSSPVGDIHYKHIRNVRMGILPFSSIPPLH